MDWIKKAYKRPELYIFILDVIATIVIICLVNYKKFDIWDYITIQYEGANGYATPVFVIDKEKMYERLMDDDNDPVKASNVDMLLKSMSVLTEAKDLKNGQTYSVEIVYNQKYEIASGVTIGKTKFKKKASKISKGTEIELFSKVDVVFRGFSKEAKVDIINKWEDEYLKSITFVADKTGNISRGDSVVVKSELSYEELARHGYICDKTEAVFVAEELPVYVDSENDISKDNLLMILDIVTKNIVSETEDSTFHMLYKATKDTEFLKHVNKEAADNVTVIKTFFLKEKENGEGADNYLYLVASADVTDLDDARLVYYVYEFANAYIDVSGKFNVDVNNLNKKYVCGTDYEEMYEKVIESKLEGYNLTEIKK